MNNFNNKSTEENNRIQAKKDIKYILECNNDNIGNDDNIENDEINLCSLNAKFYSDFRDLYNYFFNLEISLEEEFNKYLRNKNNMFIHPELVDEGDYKNSFCEYLSNELNNKIRYELKLNINDLKSQKINENVRKSLTNILGQFKERNYVEMEEILIYENEISKLISFGFEKMNEINLLKDSNIEEFKKVFLSQINYVNIDIQKEIDKRIINILSTLDTFFGINFLNKNNEPKEIENFKKEIASKKNETRILLDNNELKIKDTINKFKKDISEFLIDKISKLRDELQENIYRQILNRIHNESENSIKLLYDNIIEIINNIDSSSIKLFEEIKNFINDFLQENKKFKFIGFKSYILERMGDINKDLDSQIYHEILRFSLNKIFDNKGFFSWLKSAFSDYNYLKNNIEIITDLLVANIDSILSNLIYYLNRYIKKILHFIKKYSILATNKFTKEQSEVWEEIGEFYKSLKGSIIYAKCQLCKNI